MSMRWSIHSVFIATLCTLTSMEPAFGHHSFGLYDMGRTLDIEGTVAQMEWSNPHCWLFIQAATAAGPQNSYGFEMTSVGEMTRRGWKKTAIKPGDRVTVRYHPLRDGRTGGLMMAVITADGRPIGRAPEGPIPQNAGQAP